MHGGERQAPEDMGTWVLWWHWSVAAGAQAELLKEAKANSSAKQDACSGAVSGDPRAPVLLFLGGRKQETTVSAAFSPSNRAEQVSPSPANYSLLPRAPIPLLSGHRGACLPL